MSASPAAATAGGSAAAAAAQPELVSQLLRSETFGPGPIELRETHGSWVFLTSARAFKVKKPVVLPFLDYGTLERRREMCLEEVDVNRRAAPETYLGVRAIVPAPDGFALRGAAADGAVEYTVEMRRFPEEATLAARLERDEVTLAEAVRVGEEIASFHARCAIIPTGSGAEPVKRVVDDNFASLLALLAGDSEACARLVAAERGADAFLGSRWGRLDARAAAGLVRDGHGDLRAEHIVVGRGIEIVDAIEFDPSLRRIDVGLDLAFLVMDFEAAGRSDLGQALVAAYRAAGGDPGDAELIAFHAAYRAQVRAKVSLFRAAQLPVDSREAVGARVRARELLALAERLAWRSRGPLVLVVAGASASGKSTLAAGLSSASGLPRVSSDVVRKQLAGLRPTDRAPEAVYSARAGLATYRELGRRARDAGSVIVDATFRRRRERDAFHAGLGTTAAAIVYVECRVPAAVIESRATSRLADPERASDATPAIARRQVHEFEPLDEVAASAHLPLRADQPLERLIAGVAEALDRRQAPAGSGRRTTEAVRGSGRMAGADGARSVGRTQ
jgi:aminoglycoside phosphotransferase family enzyme/predicted kinase